MPDALARRIARNTQLVLLEEANLWRVADPAAGSGAVEVLTHELCSAAWSQFQDIERTGGIVECLNVGKLQTLIAAARSARMLAIATRKTPLTGTSEFPNLGEPSLVPVKSKRRRPLPAPQYEPLPSARLTEPFETLRDAADAHSKTTGARAKVFLANLGPVAEHGARATWIRNLLATGGIDAVNSDGFTASGDAGAAFAASGARVACICGTDETNAQLAEATTMALKSAGAERVLLAGHPGKIEDALKTAGIDTFVFAGQDVLAFLQGLHHRLGITR